MRWLVRIPLLAGVAWLLAEAAQRRGTAGAFGAALGALLLWRMLGGVIGRFAQNAFARGDVSRARLHYFILSCLVSARSSRLAVRVSLGACDLLLGEFGRALATFERVPVTGLSELGRALLLNNLAYARVRSSGDPGRAHAEIARALELVPDSGRLRHTHALVLHALGKSDDALDELAQVHKLTGDESDPLLEAERCYDLGLIWSGKGETDYARDYYVRAVRSAPESRWGKLAVGLAG